MSSLSNSCILLFVKAPQPGQVKSRLAKSIGQTHATQLYENFGLDLLACLGHLSSEVIIFFTPEAAATQVKTWLGKHHYQPQSGQDLGERLHNAFESTFKLGFERVLVIGSDSPDLPVTILQTALEALQNHEVVIGPSEDGGYYALGFSRPGFLPAVFEDISWSTQTVFAQTLSCLQHHQRKLLQLPVWYDVDTLEDLQKFHRQQQTDSWTSRYLAQHQAEILHDP